MVSLQCNFEPRVGYWLDCDRFVTSVFFLFLIPQFYFIFWDCLVSILCVRLFLPSPLLFSRVHYLRYRIDINFRFIKNALLLHLQHASKVHHTSYIEKMKCKIYTFGSIFTPKLNLVHHNFHLIICKPKKSDVHQHL